MLYIQLHCRCHLLLVPMPMYLCTGADLRQMSSYQMQYICNHHLSYLLLCK